MPAPLACFVSDCGIMEILPTLLLFKHLTEREQKKNQESSERATEANRSRAGENGFYWTREYILKMYHFLPFISAYDSKENVFIIVHQTAVTISTSKLLNFSVDVT